MKRYRERMHSAPPAARHSRSEKSDASQRRTWVTIRMFLNKTTLEIGVLGLLIGTIATIFVRHPYFQITDIRIDGLDTYAGAVAKHAVDEAQNDVLLGAPANNYVLLQVGSLQKALQGRIALDSLQITKRFPHTLIVHAAERPAAFLVEAKNGTAYVAADGTLVRWYDSGERADTQTNYTTIHLNADMQNHALYGQVIEAGIMRTLSAITSSSALIHRGAIRFISLDTETKTASMEFDAGLAITLRLDANIDVQLQKAQLSSGKYPNAKRIDVRFADKVFISF